MTHTLTEASIAQYSGGSETIYRHALTGLKYTAGVRHVAQAGGAYWLIDKIATLARHETKLRAEEFLVFKLSVNREKHLAVLTVGDGNDGPVLHHELIEFTDFPLETIKIWREGDVILLPCEH